MFLSRNVLEKRNFFGSLTVFLLFISACTSVRLIQEYDEITDQRLTALQEKSARFFVKMERQAGFPESDFKNYLSFYEDVKTELSVLEVRSRAIPKSEIVQQQIKSLQNQFTALE